MGTEVQWEGESFEIQMPRAEVLRLAAVEPLRNVRRGNATAMDAGILEAIINDLAERVKELSAS